MTQCAELSLLAPVDGIAVPLEDLPDPVFSQKMIGDGVSIDPTGNTAHAPCAGVVSQLHRAGHALTIQTDQGVSVLVHIGLDTVHLQGRGFEPLVQEGDRVQPGQALIRFDLDAIARGARSALTELVVTEGGGGFAFKRLQGKVRAGSDEMARLRAGSPDSIPSAPATRSPEQLWSAPAIIVNPHGLHARPAARLSSEARRFQASVLVSHGARTASATSVTELMNLDLVAGATVRLRAEGPDAAEAIAALRQAIADGLGENPEQAATLQQEERLVTGDAQLLGGVPASPGLAIGEVKLRSLALPSFARRAADPGAARADLGRALREVRQKLAEDRARFASAGQPEKAEVFAAHAELLQDTGLRSDAERGITRGGSAPAAWLEVIEGRCEKLRALRNPLLRQRADDLKDVGRRVLFALLGQQPPALVLDRDSVLVCEDLTPSMVSALEPGKIAAIVTASGGASSHAAIIARSMGVPYVAGLGDELARLQEGLEVIVDGERGSVQLQPGADVRQQARARIERSDVTAQHLTAQAQGPARTLDGHPVEVGANIGSARDAALAVAQGCDGVGLLRSEFLFQGRRDAPSVAEQRRQYETIARSLGPSRSLVVRTLDVGGDKPLAYMPQEEEDNPFLGLRGLRLSFRHPQIFRDQLQAVLAAAQHTRLHLMFPMVAQYDEFIRAREMVREQLRQLDVNDAVSVGVMVEVPSAALNARWLAREVDFFSIGTNDLTQYTLAMDRGHPELSARADALAPSVLQLIRMTVQAAHEEGKWVGVCGGLAADPLATPLLVGLDVDELSVPAPVIPELKHRIRALRRSECQALAEGALAMPSASVVRTLLADFQARSRQPADHHDTHDTHDTLD